MLTLWLYRCTTKPCTLVTAILFFHNVKMSPTRSPCHHCAIWSMLDTTKDKAPLGTQWSFTASKWSICQLANVQPRDSTILKANLAWMKLPYLHDQINQKGVSITFPVTDHMVKPASAETLYFTSQICRRHHQIRKEISCHGIVEKIHENPWRKWGVSCHLPSADAPAYP